MAYYAYDQATLAHGDQQTPFTLLITRHNFLSLFDVKPELGRWYEESDINKQTIVISHTIWTDYFDQDPNILERTIQINKQDYDVIGVMPYNYSNTGYTSVDLWTPINELNRQVNVVGRLKPGLTPQQAKQQSAAIQRLINRVSGDTDNIFEIHYTSMLDNMVGDTKSSLYLLLASVIAVLNVVNLTFAQYANRTQELAVRVSVGATRTRLLKQLLTESLVLCFMGGAVGILFSAWALEWIRMFVGNQIPRLHEIGLDQNTVLVALGLISISVFATTLIPAYSIVHPNKLADAIKQAGRKVTGDVKSQRIRRLLVSGEIGVAVVLLVCAGLLMRSYAQLANQDTGFNTTNIVTGHIWLPENFNPAPNTAGYWLNVAKELEKLPDVKRVAATSTMPMSRTGIDYPVNYTYPGAPSVPRGEEPMASVRSITQGYFELLDVPLLSGRDFAFSDTADSPRVVIINKKLAETAWPDRDAIGNVLSLPEWMGGEHTVVGVVDNVKHRGLRATPIEEFFLPVTQHSYAGMTFLLETNNEPTALLENRMRQTAFALESTAPMVSIDTLDVLTRESIVGEKLLLTVLSVFASIALMLASIGVYGISDNMVAQRTNEIGIRMAIGARPQVIKWWIILDTSKPVLVGAAIGVILAIIASQFMASALFGVNTLDPITFLGVPLVLVLVGLLATWLPARRATRVHPQQALHYE